MKLYLNFVSMWFKPYILHGYTLYNLSPMTENVLIAKKTVFKYKIIFKY